MRYDTCTQKGVQSRGDHDDGEVVKCDVFEGRRRNCDPFAVLSCGLAFLRMVVGHEDSFTPLDPSAAARSTNRSLTAGFVMVQDVDTGR